MTTICFVTQQVKKHIKQGQGHEGGIFSVEAPLHVSNVQVIDPVTGYELSVSRQNLVGFELYHLLLTLMNYVACAENLAKSVLDI